MIQNSLIPNLVLVVVCDREPQRVYTPDHHSYPIHYRAWLNTHPEASEAGTDLAKGYTLQTTRCGIGHTDSPEFCSYAGMFLKRPAGTAEWSKEVHRLLLQELTKELFRHNAWLREFANIQRRRADNVVQVLDTFK